MMNVPNLSKLSKGDGSPYELTPGAIAVNGIRRAQGEHRKQNFTKYQTDPAAYCREVLKFEPWAGENNQSGQLELCQDVGESVRGQLAGEDGAIRRFRVEAGNGVGKTWICAGFTNWFFDSFVPSIVYTTAPSGDQVKFLLWKDIKSQRPEHLPGRVLPSEPYMEKASNHFAIGRSTDDSRGKGEERSKGQHGKYLLFILDEAEGVEDFFWDAVEAMLTGGTVVLVIMIANPKTRTSRFHKMGSHPGVKNYRMSVLDHPNVVHGREVVPGATTRRWVDEQIDKECDLVNEHAEDDFTFEVPWRRGIFRPSTKFMTMVLGVAPKNSGDKIIISVGRFENSKNREILTSGDTVARIGVDVARWGSDLGSGFYLHNNVAKRYARWAKLDTTQYAGDTKELALQLHSQGVTEIHVRIDGGGGFGGGVIDQLKNDPDFMGLWKKVIISEVEFGRAPHTEDAYKSYYDLVTWMYAEAAETMKGIRIDSPPNELEEDLTARLYRWKNRKSVSVKKLEEKDIFRDRVKRSPDDGDAFVLCVAPIYMFDDDGMGGVRLGGLSGFGHKESRW